MTDKQIIIEDCPHFIGGCCQEYLDGVCENHKCDLKIIRELEQKLKAKEQECEELKIYIESNEQQVKEVETLVMDNDRLINELYQLKAENEHLSEKEEEVKHYLEEAQKFKNCLTEIKELLLKTPTDSQEHCVNAKSVIQQKISECEV